MGVGSVAQWIEQLRPKEKVGRSTRLRATIFFWVLYVMICYFGVVGMILIYLCGSSIVIA